MAGSKRKMKEWEFSAEGFDVITRQKVEEFEIVDARDAAEAWKMCCRPFVRYSFLQIREVRKDGEEVYGTD